MHARTKLVIAAAIALVGAGAWSCSSSSSNATPGEEGGTDSGLDTGSGSSSGASSSGGGSSGGSSSGGGSEGGADAGDGGSAGIKHVFYIMMENHGYAEIVGNTADAPYINMLATTYGVASNYFGVTHPSLPNYLAAISGDYQGIFDDCAAGMTSTCPPEEFVPGSGDPTAADPLTDAEVASATAQAHWFTGQNLVDQLETKGLTWKAYMQSIPAAGSTVVTAPTITPDGGDAGDAGPTSYSIYVQKHDPFMYFSDIRNSTTRMNLIVPDTLLTTDLTSASTTPNFVWISPDQCHDMHGTSAGGATVDNAPTCAYPASGLDHGAIALGDDYVKQTVMAIMASPAWQDDSVIVIPWDEDDYAGYAGCCNSPTGVDGGVLGGANAPLIVITSKNAKHQTFTTAANQYSLLATIESVWGLPCLGNACAIEDAGASNLLTSLFMP